MSQTLADPTLVLTRDPSRFNPDRTFAFITRSAACLIILMLVSLVTVLAVASVPAVKAYGLKFLVSSEWRPNSIEVPKRGPDGKVVVEDGGIVTVTIPPAFGALPVIYGTAVSSVIALLVAIPLALGSAVFLVRIAPWWLVAPVSFLIEFLAAIPSIAYGIWGLFVLSPFLQKYGEPFLARFVGGSETALNGRDMLCGGLILGVMILPIVTAISRDVLRGVPRAQIEGSIALGATWWQSVKEMLKYSRAGLFGAVMLGLARAAGETMAIAMVIGNNNQIKASLFAPAQTMSSLLANEFAEASDELHRAALICVALVLLLMSLVFNMTARRLVVGKGARTAAAH